MSRPGIDDVNAETGLMGLGNIPGLAPVAAFNIDQIESLLKTKGIRALHYRSALNPDKASVESGLNLNTKAAQYGFIYYSVRELLIVPQHLSLQTALQVQGMFDNQSASVLNLTGNYVDGDKGPVYVKPHDIIVLSKLHTGEPVTVMTEQLVEYDPNAPLKLKYKAKGVEVLFTRDQAFQEGTDFAIGQDGRIYWLQGRKPKFFNGKGEVVSVVYYIAPHYVVNNVPHVLRILPSNPQGSGAVPRQATYAPQQVVAVQSHLTEAANYLDFFGLPDYQSPNNSPNTAGG